MTGWKTKVGGICTTLGGVLFAASEVVPRPDWKPWFVFFSVIFATAGASLLGVGIAHKIEKAAK